MLQVKNVSKRYANHLALDGVSLTVKKGSVFGLLGPNGAGKTTLIRIINQITAPDTGEVLLDGQIIKREHVAMIGYLPEERGLYKKMKVGEQAVYLARLKGLSHSVAIASLKEWFIHFGIESWWDKKVEELSKGMQQKVQFIITVVHQPKLLIFDEPFSGFDPINTELLKQEILTLKEKGATVIFSTHSMSSVEEVCDDIALINQSRVIVAGSVKEIKASFSQRMYTIQIAETMEELARELPDHIEIVEEKSKLENVVLKIKESSSPKELVQWLANNFTLQSFNELLPSMNDIFIQKVNETNH